MIIFGNEKLELCFHSANGTLEEIRSPLAHIPLKSKLWSVKAGDKLLSPEDMDQFSHNVQGNTLCMQWENADGAVRTVFTDDNGTIRWRIHTLMNSLPVKQVDFPVLEGLKFPNGGDLLLSWQNGSVIENAVEDFLSRDLEVPFWMGRGKGEYVNEYPAGMSYQFGAYYAKDYGFYFVTEDPEAYIKTYTYRYNPAVKGMDYIVTHYPENIGTATGYYMPYDFVLDIFKGDWRWAANRYRTWATKQKWCKVKLSDKKLPETVTEVDLWRVNHTDTPLGRRTQEYFDTSLQLRDAMDCKLGLHWYGWNQRIHGDGYPDFMTDESKKAGWPQELKKWNDRFTAEGIRKIPYINARLWNAYEKSWEDEGAAAAAVKAEGNKQNLEPWTNEHALMTICPATTLWQNKCYELCQEYVMAEGFDGVYLDQIASFNAMLCFDPSHPHPVGGGNWWSNSYHSIIRSLRSLMGNERIMTTESCCETYVDCLDLFLTLDPNNQGSAFNALAGKIICKAVPLFNMIYGDYALSYGSICTLSDTPENFAFNFVRNTLWGIIPSVDGVSQAELDDPATKAHLAVMKQCVDFYKANKELFLYGRLTDIVPCQCAPMTLQWNIKRLGVREEITDSAIVACWQTATGEKKHIAYNFLSEAQTVTCDGEKLQLNAREFKIW